MGIFFCVFTFLAIRYIDPKSILISSYMSLFKKLFTEKMFFIVVGTCVCVLVVFFTLGIIEGVVWIQGFDGHPCFGADERLNG